MSGSQELRIPNAQVVSQPGDTDLPTGYRMTHFLVAIPAAVERVVNDHEQLAVYERMTTEQAREAFRTLDPEMADGALRIFDAVAGAGRATVG